MNSRTSNKNSATLTTLTTHTSPRYSSTARSNNHHSKAHTRGLMNVSKHIMEANDVTTEVIRAVDYDIAPGVQPDMTEHGRDSDDWPVIFDKVMNSDILIIGSPIWLGEKSSECTKVIERLYGNSHLNNDKGQYTYYGKTGGCIITGNEDGVKHCSMSILYALQHIGYTIPHKQTRGGLAKSVLDRPTSMKKATRKTTTLPTGTPRS